MASRQDIIMAELKANGGAMWMRDMEAVHNADGLYVWRYNRAMKSLEKFGFIRKTAVTTPAGVRVWVEVVERCRAGTA